jgi:eukaryotic-like serine/threonine-protein kinase
MADEAILGRFTVLQVLRGDGPVRSYLARTADGIDVCVKSVDFDPNSAHAALRAMATLQSIQSPNLARVVDSGRTETGYYFAREWVAGTHLGTHPLPVTLPPAKAAAAVAQGLGGLAAIHAAGLVCGDLKPTSFVVGADGVTRLVDVVLPPVRVREDSGPAQTAYYTSPEELQSQNPTQRTDLYRAGLVLYEAVAGRPPFGGVDAAAVAFAQRSAMPVAPSALNPAAPKGLDAVSMRALSKDPTMRYESAIAMKGAIEAHTKKGVSPWVWIGIAAAVVVALLGGGLWYFTHRTPAPPATVVVPGIVGKTQSAAEASITASGLGVGKVSIEETLGLAPGLVTAQTPAPGASVSPSSSVNFTVAKIPRAKVPTVTAVSESDAIGLLAEQGLRAGAITYAFDSKVKAGFVISQVPQGGAKVPIGSFVALTVSKGVQVGLVPNVIGLSEEDAKATLAADGFTITSVKATSPSIAADMVMQQSPAAGAAAASGSSVALTVSSGAPQAPKVAVPSLVGKSPHDARNVLTSLNLRSGWAFVTATSPSSALKVQLQAPAAGVQVAVGTTVVMTIGLPSASAESASTPPPAPAPAPKPTPTPTPTPSPSASAGTVPTIPAGSKTTTP